MNILIVCHAGEGIGLGHLRRSLVAARALQTHADARVYLLIQGETVANSDLALFPHITISANEDLGSAMELLTRRLETEIAVFDLQPNRIPQGLKHHLNNLRQHHCKVVGIDAVASIADGLDLAFIPSFFDIGLTGLPPTLPTVSGWGCFLLDVKLQSRPWQPGNQVLVLSGGSDATGLGITWPRLIDERLPAGTSVNWVTGPYAKQPVWPASPRLNLINHQAPEGLDQLMVNSNYAATAFGVSFFELLYYGIPTVVFSPYQGKDNAELACLAEMEVALVASDEDDATKQLTHLMQDNELAKNLSRQAKSKLSAPNGRRLVQEILNLVGRR